MNFKSINQLQILKTVVNLLSGVILIGSVYFFLQMPTNLWNDVFFRLLCILFVVNMIVFVFFKIKFHQTKQSQSSKTILKTKDPKPHSKA